MSVLLSLRRDRSCWVLAAIGEASRDTVRLPSVDSVYVPLWARASRTSRYARPTTTTTTVTVTVTVSTNSNSGVASSLNSAV